MITISYRKDAPRHLLASRQRLAELGIEVQQTDRGGDITYHGPGQLVAYPIVRLNPRGLNLSRYMRLLEKVVIDTLASFNVQGFREEGATGVWVDSGEFQVSSCKFQVEEAQRDSGNLEPETSNLKLSKICAMGVRVRKNTTMHGLALNVDPDLSHFQTIVPCGLHGRSVTSLKQLLGDESPTMQEVKDRLVASMRKAIV